MRARAVLVLVLLTVPLTACGGTTAKPLQIGAVVAELRYVEQQDDAIVLMKGAGLADVARVDAGWRRGQTTMDPGMRSDLRDGIDKAQAAGIEVYLSLYPDGSSQTPITDRDRADFAAWVVDAIAAMPNLRHVIIGNEPNLNLFWFPQFGPSGQDVAAVGYERLLARTYDAVKRAAPKVEVLGGALAHSGTDKPGTGRDTHSPGQFILDLAAAYRASHRTRPIMDAFTYHPYMERSDLSPTLRHARSKTLTIADYGRLVSLLGRAFDGTKQPGSTMPIVYDEFGVEASVPAARASGYRGREPASTHPVSEATQAAYYAAAFRLAACQPTVRAIMIFQLVDSPLRPGFQSGVFYADRSTPRSSRARIAAAAMRYRDRNVEGCG
jgi:hypothetical protein